MGTAAHLGQPPFIQVNACLNITLFWWIVNQCEMNYNIQRSVLNIRFIPFSTNVHSRRNNAPMCSEAVIFNMWSDRDSSPLWQIVNLLLNLPLRFLPDVDGVIYTISFSLNLRLVSSNSSRVIWLMRHPSFPPFGGLVVLDNLDVLQYRSVASCGTSSFKWCGGP